jgi:hypothetical protein
MHPALLLRSAGGASPPRRQGILSEHEFTFLCRRFEQFGAVVASSGGRSVTLSAPSSGERALQAPPHLALHMPPPPLLCAPLSTDHSPDSVRSMADAQAAALHSAARAAPAATPQHPHAPMPSLMPLAFAAAAAGPATPTRTLPAHSWPAAMPRAAFEPTASAASALAQAQAQGRRGSMPAPLPYPHAHQGGASWPGAYGGGQ